MEYKQADILKRQKAQCLAEGREWIEPENRPVPKALNEKDRHCWEAERKAGEAYHARIQAELGKAGR